MVPAAFTIGDDLLFAANNVKAGRSPYPYIPDADLSYQLVHARTRVVVSEGEMTLYDAVTASYEGVIPRTDLGLYDADTNPDGVRPRDLYVLRVTVDDGGVLTTLAAEMVAVLDPDSPSD